MSKRACTEDDYLKVMALTDQGASLAEIVAATGVSRRTIIRMRNGQWEPPRGPSMPLLGGSQLTGVIMEHIDDGWSLDDLTVLARGNDPFRQDSGEGPCTSQAFRARVTVNEEDPLGHTLGLRP